MPIKARCACGRSLVVKDELAGKLVKCPDCKEPLRIPSEDEETPKKRSQDIRRQDDADPFSFDLDRPARRSRRAGSRYDDDYDDEYDDDYDDRPRRRGGRERKMQVSGFQVTMLSIGIGALVLMAVSAFPAVYSPSVSVSSKVRRSRKRSARGRKTSTRP
jgi:hypothetical protein